LAKIGKIPAAIVLSACTSLFHTSAIAQTPDPAFVACQKLAVSSLIHHTAIGLDEKEFKRENYSRNAGSQHVALVVSGKATLRIQFVDSPVHYREIHYVCLLADENNAIFFHQLIEPTEPSK